MNNELDNNIMLDLLRRRADREHRELRRAMRENERLNAQFTDNFLRTVESELRKFHKLGESLPQWINFCDVVLPGELPPRGNGGQGHPNGKRQAVGRFGDDVCGMEHTVRAQATREELGQRSHGYSNGYGPRPRQAVPFTGGYN